MKEIWCWKEEKWVDPEDAIHKREKCLDTEMVIEREEYHDIPRWDICVACSGMSLKEVRFHEGAAKGMDGNAEDKMVEEYYNPPKDR